MFASRLDDFPAVLLQPEGDRPDLVSSLGNLTPAIGSLVSVVEPDVAHSSCRLRLQQNDSRGVVASGPAVLDDEAKELRRQAQEVYIGGPLARVEAALRRCNEHSCDDHAVHHVMGTIALLEHKDLESARECFEKAVEHARPVSLEDAACALIGLACVCEAAGDLVSALAHAEAARRVSGRLPEAHYAVARCLALNNRGDDQIGQYLVTAFRGGGGGEAGWSNSAFWDLQPLRIDLCLLATCDNVLSARSEVVAQALALFRDELAELCKMRAQGLSEFLCLIENYLASIEDEELRAILRDGSERLEMARLLSSKETILDIYQSAHTLRDTAWSLGSKSVSAALVHSRRLAAQGQRSQPSEGQGAIGRFIDSATLRLPRRRLSSHMDAVSRAKALASQLEQARQAFQGMRCTACCGGGTLHGSDTPCNTCGGSGFVRASW